jgi:hypothetical protein
MYIGGLRFEHLTQAERLEAQFAKHAAVAGLFLLLCLVATGYGRVRYRMGDSVYFGRLLFLIVLLCWRFTRVPAARAGRAGLIAIYPSFHTPHRW